MSQPLSPATQAVLNAFLRAPCDNELSVAAALRAAADHPYEVPPWYRGDDYWTYRNGVDAERNRLRAIAAELEADRG